MLHCPATIVLAGPEDEAARAALTAELRDRRIAMVYSGTAEPARTVAAALAADLDAGAAESAELTGLDPEACGRAELAHRLQSVADLHRGETVLVIADRSEASAAPIEVEIGDDGVRIVHRTR